MSDYTDTLAALAASAEGPVVALTARWQAGELTVDEYVTLAVAALLAASSRGVALADLALASYLTAATGTAVPALGLLPPSPAGLLVAVREFVAADDHTPEAAGVLARAETLAAAQDAYSTALTRRGVPAWTRALNAGACELCQDLAGVVLPGSAPMYHHRGCGCSQRPILEGAPV